MSTELSGGARNKQRLWIALGLAGTYLVAEVVGGLMTGSLALLADAGHMLTDVGGLALALTAISFSQRPATPERTYGYYRAEILAALANGVVLIGISVYILFEAYRRFQNPPEVAGGAMLVVAGIGLVVNLAGLFILKDSAEESAPCMRARRPRTNRRVAGSSGTSASCCLPYWWSCCSSG